MTRHKHHRIKLRSMYQWHRYLGVSIAAFVLLLSITGVMLNHTAGLALDKRYIKNNWLLDWYGISAPEQVRSYHTAGGWLSQWGEHVFLDKQSLGTYHNKLLGAVSYRGMLILALEGTVLMFTAEGELIEALHGEQGVPAGMWAIGLSSDQRVVVNSAHGTYLADTELLRWQDSKVDTVKWSAPSNLPDPIHQAVLELYRGRGLNMERVILDLHSGRLFGQYGVYFTDMIGLLMVFLACSGLWLWAMRLIRERERRQHQ